MKKMYICPTCNKGFKNSEGVTKHSLQCWRAYNPNHDSKSAPSESKTQRQINNDISQFFARFNVCQK